VVKEAITAYKAGGVNAMHDPTEGGVAGGIHEMADASSLGFKVSRDKITVSPETKRICRFFNIDPLMLISSGALLISAEPKSSERIIELLGQKHISASIIGEFVENPRERTIMDRKGKAKPLERPLSDHLWKALARE
jgi:hydrogenase maturation factor